MHSVVRFVVLILVAIILLSIAQPARSRHNYDPDNPITHIDRGYNKKNCEMLRDVQGNKGVWLGHEVGCLINGLVIGEFRVKMFKGKGQSM